MNYFIWQKHPPNFFVYIVPAYYLNVFGIEYDNFVCKLL